VLPKVPTSFSSTAAGEAAKSEEGKMKIVSGLILLTVAALAAGPPGTDQGRHSAFIPTLFVNSVIPESSSATPLRKTSN
jgi:hypothetical protein